jgi:hypothetical protein
LTRGDPGAAASARDIIAWEDQLTGGWIRSVGKTWLGNDLFTGTTGALASSLLVLGVLWTFCWWLYRRKVFIRI